MTTAYSYVQDLPVAVGELLTEATREFAARRGVEAEPWYHGLPIWIVRESRGRVNKVQVEAVVQDARALVSFTPAAFEDSTKSKGVTKKLHRKVASAGDIMRGRRVLELQDLWERGTGGQSQPAAGALESLLEMLDITLAHAKNLPLAESIDITYKTPFAS